MEEWRVVVEDCGEASETARKLGYEIFHNLIVTWIQAALYSKAGFLSTEKANSQVQRDAWRPRGRGTKRIAEHY